MQTRTKFPHSVVPAGISHVNGQYTSILKKASDNAKLSNDKAGVWTKGAFKGLPLYSLTLEERATCEVTCAAWDLCYGNHMAFASRWDVTQDNGHRLMTILEEELDILDIHHPSGYSIRLHILGDFFSTSYVAWWGKMLRLHPLLKVYGYSHRTGTIGRAITRIYNSYPGRFVIFNSDGNISSIGKSNSRPLALLETTKGANQLPTCPKQTHKTESCLTCGLCTNPNVKGVTFELH